MRSTSVLFFLCFFAVLIAANPIAAPTEGDEHRGTQLSKRDLEDADSITHTHAPFDRRTPVRNGKTGKTGKTTKKTTPKGPKKTTPKGPKSKPKQTTKGPKNAKDPIACPLRKPGAKTVGGKKTTGKSRRDLERRCAGTPSVKWKTYNTKGAGYLQAYEGKRTAGANKGTEAAAQKVLDEEYFAKKQEGESADVNLRDYMNKVLKIDADSLTSGYTQYETYSCKPPPNAESLSVVKLGMYMNKNCNKPAAYRNLFDTKNGVILAESNFAEKDTNRARTDLTTKVSLSDILFLQYKKQAAADGGSIPKLRYLAQVKVVGTDSGEMMVEAHAHVNAPADNVIPGWKKWLMSDAKQKEVLVTLLGTDNGKTSAFILQDWAGYLAKKSIVAVHTNIEPTSKAKYMIWEFSP